MKPKLGTSASPLLWLLLASASGQQSFPPTTQTSVSPMKSQIVQPEVKPGKAADASSLLITFHGCADLVLSDPRGRKLGYDATGKSGRVAHYSVQSGHRGAKFNNKIVATLMQFFL